MEFYLIAVVILFALAIGDLVVGVSNDAVNFLNSAVGSRVSSRRVILIVASLGIVLGATFSSGMMEIARKGIFNPQFFVFAEIMTIFLAVMITDIILLDFFNTFGLPTSTTVSIVFELLGAAVVVSLVKIVRAGDAAADLGTYINSDKALAIIVGILLSVAVSFIIGALVQYLSRLLFTFEYERRAKYVGSLWGGLALTLMSYFLIVKGFRGASFVSDAFVSWVAANSWTLVGLLFVGWVAVAQTLMWLKVNIFRVVVLMGTFALAMAFAGNDLVNFIGVSIAGLESFTAWSASGASPDTFAMTDLAAPVRTDTWILVLAGLVMAVTLWISKKAQAVTKTEVNLGRQDEGIERFTPNEAARVAVRAALGLAAAMRSLIPAPMRARLEGRFRFARRPLPPSGERPAFDLIRASVNLAVASMLIAFATSLKLPLSTTYVSFMVAMGTSLSDRAWGRDSAVYRVAGVLSVIGGWFLTALVAFTVAGVFALLLALLGGFGLVLLLGVVGLSLYRGIHLFKKRSLVEDEAEASELGSETAHIHDAFSDVYEKAVDSLSSVSDVFEASFTGLFTEKRKALKRTRKSAELLRLENDQLGSKLPNILRKSQDDPQLGNAFVRLYDEMHEILVSLHAISDAAYTYINNQHSPLEKDQVKRLTQVQKGMVRLLKHVVEAMRVNVDGEQRDLESEKDQMLDLIGACYDAQVDGLRDQKYGRKNTQLVLKLLLESKDIAAVSVRIPALHAWTFGSKGTERHPQPVPLV